MIGTAIILAAIILSPEVAISDIGPWIEEGGWRHLMLIVLIIIGDLYRMGVMKP